MFRVPSPGNRVTVLVAGSAPRETDSGSHGDGAPPERLQEQPEIDRGDDRRYVPLETCAEVLEGVERFIIATDADGPGNLLAEELARRLGRERCYRVQWPTINDAPRKDADEVLMNDGADVLSECIEAAEPWPILGLYRGSDFQDRLFDLYRHGHERAYSTGWLSLDPYVKIRPGELSVITGIPGHGKSEFVDATMVNLALEQGWRFAVCSFENSPEEHLAKLAEKYIRAPFGSGPTPRMGEDELKQALDWIDDHFFFIRADDDAPTSDWILEKARAAVLRHGIRGLVIAFTSASRGPVRRRPQSEPRSLVGVRRLDSFGRTPDRAPDNAR